MLILIGHCIDNFTIGGFDETILVDPAIGGQGADQPDVGAFRRLDRADTAVVGVMDIPHIEPGPLSSETTRPQSGKAALVGQFSQRIGLVHELAELTPAEEFAGGSHHGADVDQGHGGQLLWVTDAHAFAHHSFHTQQPNAQLVLDELTHCLDTPVAQMVYIILGIHPIIDHNHVLHHFDQVFPGQSPMEKGDIKVKAPVKLMAAHLAQIIAPAGEK